MGIATSVTATDTMEATTTTRIVITRVMVVIRTQATATDTVTATTIRIKHPSRVT